MTLRRPAINTRCYTGSSRRTGPSEALSRHPIEEDLAASRTARLTRELGIAIQCPLKPFSMHSACYSCTLDGNTWYPSLHRLSPAFLETGIKPLSQQSRRTSLKCVFGWLRMFVLFSIYIVYRLADDLAPLQIANVADGLDVILSALYANCEAVYGNVTSARLGMRRRMCPVVLT